jgi:hypothetical protein
MRIVTTIGLAVRSQNAEGDRAEAAWMQCRFKIRTPRPWVHMAFRRPSGRDCRPRARGCPPGLFTQVRRYVANGHHGFDESGILRSEHLLRTKG